jgi:hypothetical protein
MPGDAREAERAKKGALYGGLGSAAMVAADLAGNKKTPAPGQAFNQQPAFGLDAALRAASRGLSFTGNVATKDWESAGVNALGMAAAVQAGLRPKPAEPQTEADWRAAQARKRMEAILGPAPRISTLNDASNLADAALAYRQSDKAEEAASASVAGAERALAAARQTGDQEAIRQAEASLSQARRAAEGALMGSIAAGDALMTTPQAITGQRRAAHAFEGAVDAYDDFLATKSRAVSLANRSGPFTETGEAAAGEWSRLTAAKERYERDLFEAQGDPDKIKAAVARFRDEQAEVGTRLAAIESKAQAPVYGDGLAAPPTEARIIPASAQQGTTPPRDIRAEARKHVEIDQSILSEAEEEILRRARRDREGFAYKDPRLVSAADDMGKALSELKALGDDPNATDAEILAASLRLNVARNTLGQTLHPTPGAPDPLVVGINTFVEEFGSRALNLITLGGKAGIDEALKDGRLNAESGFRDFTKAYWEGVLNGVTFGGANEYWQSRADRQGVIDSLSMGLLRFGEGVFAVDEYKVLTDPKSNDWEKAEALASMVAKYASLGAGGKALQERITWSVWSEPDVIRGKLIHDNLTKTEYKDWHPVGEEAGGTFELVDFQKGGDLVSLKSVNTAGKTWMSRMRSHIRDLATRGATVGGQPANMILDVRVPPGGAAAAQPLVIYGKKFGVTVIVKEIH